MRTRLRMCVPKHSAGVQSTWTADDQSENKAAACY